MRACYKFQNARSLWEVVAPRTNQCMPILLKAALPRHLWLFSRCLCTIFITVYLSGYRITQLSLLKPPPL